MTTPSPIASTQSADQDPVRGPSSQDEATPGTARRANSRREEIDGCSVDPLRATDRYRLTRPLLDTPFQRSEG